jgi:hypothetical protein
MTTEDADVLLVTTKIDSASDAVANALANANVKFYRLNTEDLPLAARSSIGLWSGRSWASWRSEGCHVALDSVKRVWFRRHRLPTLPSD